MAQPTLETQRLRLRAFGESDAGDLARLVGEWVIFRVLQFLLPKYLQLPHFNVRDYLSVYPRG